MQAPPPRCDRIDQATSIDRPARHAWGDGVGSRAEAGAPADILALAEERNAAKKARDFKRADTIRDELKAKGWVIEDTPKGIKLKKI